ncbi:Uncharacterised protein [Mycobacteroides abscessus subsp. abscessus]|nr:Uncharacterised protein [Mycobacteroides abscessus subsp. abscessus]
MRANCVTCSVTVCSWASASASGSRGAVNPLVTAPTGGISTDTRRSIRYRTIIIAWLRSSTACL